MKEIYPSISIVKRGNSLTFRTQVRKKNVDGVYWLRKVIKNHLDQSLDSKLYNMGNFHVECYMVLVTEDVIQGIFLEDGSLMWEVDINQEDEELRISRAYKFGL